MSKTLIIAEKPSVALDLTRALGKLPEVGKFEKVEASKRDSYHESESFIVSSAIGHLVELCMPNQQTGAKLKWSFEHLPIMPESFELQPIEDSKPRLQMLIKLMKRKDVGTIINACDAGREGELIFRYLIQIAGVNKPMKRMWMQSMTNQAIVDSFRNPRSDEEMLPLANAAMCRSESDWLVGINGTRAMTAFNSRYGGFTKTPVGRVKTPTLAILVERENQILSFVPRDYWEVQADFAVNAGIYQARWFDETFKKEEDDHDRAERIWDKGLADAIVARCRGKQGEVEEKKKPRKESAPLLYDLTSLQREANGRFGFSAKRTLELAQRLYEKHKVLTYPRTDSRYLPEDYVAVAAETMKKLSGGGASLGDNAKHAGKALANGWVRPNKRTFDNTKVSDHFAIIPTGELPGKLDDVEYKLYQMVLQRFIAVFFPAAEFELTTRITRIAQDAFKTEGKIMLAAGWREVYGGEVGSEKDKILVPVGAAERALAERVETEAKVTKPPARYTEATILSAMEGAGKLVDDEELRAAMSERGLGTPATRAATLEGLIADKYIIRSEKELIPTQTGRKLIERLQEIGVDILASPEMTGQWEHKLKRMEHGELRRDTFMSEIRRLTDDVVARAKISARDAKEKTFEPLQVPCPICGTSPLRQEEGSYRCTGCKFSIWKTIASRPMEESEIVQLLTRKFLEPRDGFRSRRGDEFTAALEIGESGKVGFVTEKSQEREREAGETERQDNVVAKCPICDSTIHDTDTAYVCRNNARNKCKSRLPKEMCKRQITPAEARAFFEEGRTPLITDFISKRNRPFKAHLVLNREGNRLFSWEFPPREGKGGDEAGGGGKAPSKKATRKVARKQAANRS
ncbi:MAG: DNA topoisomerase-3 [Verrucomicrobia bacterium]|jgi:DNA topoisomerase-3|nr:MAG: DNA topoisomerase-3 [Verrucomicrobiota bacterium]